MKRTTPVLLFLVSMSAWASMPTALSLPQVAHADTEVVTNVPLPALSRRAAKFAFSLGCSATPTNNVEMALGTAPLDFELPTLPPDWLFDADWNLMRLTGRGLDVQNGSFNVQFMPESFTVILR